MIVKDNVIITRLFTLLPLLLVFSASSFGQLKHELHVQAGMSKIPSNTILVFSEPTESEVLDNFDISWSFGYRGMKNFENGFALQFGADALLLTAKRMESYYRSDENFTNSDSEITASYLAFPLLAGIKKQNITVLTGVRASINLSSKIESESFGETDGIEFSSTSSGEGILDVFNLGHHTELRYGFGEKLEVIVNYYYGFNAIIKNNNSANYYQQLSIGVGYLLN